MVDSCRSWQATVFLSSLRFTMNSSRNGYNLGKPSLRLVLHPIDIFLSRVHFIPISTSYTEIYNIHAYFSGATQSTAEAANATQKDLSPEERRPSEGDKRLRRIARAGKRWKRTVGRTLDMEGKSSSRIYAAPWLNDLLSAYVYRLCLEWARLWADDRDSMNFSL